MKDINRRINKNSHTNLIMEDANKHRTLDDWAIY